MTTEMSSNPWIQRLNAVMVDAVQAELSGASVTSVDYLSDFKRGVRGDNQSDDGDRTDEEQEDDSNSLERSAEEEEEEESPALDASFNTNWIATKYGNTSGKDVIKGFHAFDVSVDKEKHPLGLIVKGSSNDNFLVIMKDMFGPELGKAFEHSEYFFRKWSGLGVREILGIRFLIKNNYPYMPHAYASRMNTDKDEFYFVLERFDTPHRPDTVTYYREDQEHCHQWSDNVWEAIYEGTAELYALTYGKTPDYVNQMLLAGFDPEMDGEWPKLQSFVRDMCHERLLPDTKADVMQQLQGHEEDLFFGQRPLASSIQDEATQRFLGHLPSMVESYVQRLAQKMEHDKTNRYHNHFQLSQQIRWMNRYRHLIQTSDEWMSEKDSLPQCLRHNDFSPRNFGFKKQFSKDSEGNETESLKLCAWDWEGMGWGLPTDDLMYLLYHTLTAEDSMDFVVAKRLEQMRLALCQRLTKQRKVRFALQGQKSADYQDVISRAVWGECVSVSVKEFALFFMPALISIPDFEFTDISWFNMNRLLDADETESFSHRLNRLFS